MSFRYGLWLLVPFCATLFFRDLDASDLWSSHEARAAQNAQQMLDDNEWGLPRLFDGQVEMQKPPAFYWIVAAAGYLNGGTVDRWSVRLPCAISASLTVLMLYLALALRGRPLAGFIAATVLASSIHFVSLARTGRIDMVLTCVIAACLISLYTNRRSSVFLAGLSMGIGLLLKGPIGLVLPVAVMICWGLYCRLSLRERAPDCRLSLRERAPDCRLSLRERASFRGAKGDNGQVVVASAAAFGILFALPWFIWANQKTNGEFFRVFFWYHNVDRAMGSSSTLATYPLWYYVPRFAIDFLPWTPALIAALVCFCRVRRRPVDPLATFGLLWFAVMFGLLSLARFKRADYLLPAYPGAGLFIGCIAEHWYQQWSPTWRRVSAAAFCMLMAGSLAGWWWFHRFEEPKQQAVREQQAFAEHIRRAAPVPSEVMLFRVESHLLAFHLGRPIHTLVEWAELNERLAEPGLHWFVTRAEFVPECLQNVRSRKIEVAGYSADFSPARPLRPLVLMHTIAEPTSCQKPSSKD